MKRYNLLNNIVGWVAFVVAALTYLSTIEPTGSFWDCGEFIATVFKFDVGHPPGAPFFMLLGKFFILFTSDTTHIAAMVNSLSALCSAFTILFLFWTITHLLRKIVIKNEETDFTLGNIIAILGSGLTGALAYTFSDSFWFSAVEGEVYALSSLFTAVVFWLILKWEQHADSSGSDRWLILIAYLTGLSVGVHLLNLLTIPAIVLVYYFKRNETPTAKGVTGAVLISFAIIIFVMYGLMQGFVQMAAWFELLFVNNFGMPYNSGLYVYLALAVTLLTWAVILTRNPKNPKLTNLVFIFTMSFIGVPFLMGNVWIGILVIAIVAAFFYFKKQIINARWLNTIIVMAVVMLVGYASFGIILIRAAALPTMNENTPDNVFALKAYLNREQYGAPPLFYGPVYNAVPELVPAEGNTYHGKVKQGAAVYAKIPKTDENQKDRYIIANYKQEQVYKKEFMTVFPRMHSNSPAHIAEYKSWANMRGKTVRYEFAGQWRTETVPSFGDNLAFFFNYQVRYMYLRYFMWNFSGRQNDLQGNGEIHKGNWITGIPFLDNHLAGINEHYPTEMATNRAYNRYFMLPFLLGLLGIFWQLNKGKKGKQSFWITMSLFFLTGLAIVMYLNQPPLQPRERDYAYAGSFYAFAIWIGLGVMGITSLLKKLKLSNTVAATLATVFGLGVSALMAQQNWDDHNRSGRYAARDFGANYLNSCEPNAILFSNGDNDTFPLWYNQEVEGVRTDVRVCNLSYIQTDWYIDQMKRGSYESEPLPISLQRNYYIGEKNSAVYYSDKNSINQPIDVKTAFEFITSDAPSTQTFDGENFLPSKDMYIPVNADEVIASGTLPESRRDEIVPRINFSFPSRLLKGEMALVDMLSENHWKRPVYFASTIAGFGSSLYLGLDKNGHFELTGMVEQVLPINSIDKSISINVEKTYENVMNKFQYGNVADPKVYSDETVRRMISSHRMVFCKLADALIAMGDSVRAKNVLDKHFEVFPPANTYYDDATFLVAIRYYRIGQTQTANALMEDYLRQNNEFLRWGFSLNRSQRNSAMRELAGNFSLLTHSLNLFEQYGQKELFEKYIPVYQRYVPNFQQ